MPALNSFEAAFQDLLIQWIGKNIDGHTQDLAGGALLQADTPADVAMRYASTAATIRTLRDVLTQCKLIEDQLSGK
jgi:hypothetical protein